MGSDGEADMCENELSCGGFVHHRVRMRDHTRSRQTVVLHCAFAGEFVGGRSG